MPIVLLLGCVATALAGRHLSSAHSGAVALHALAGVSGLVLALGAAAWVMRPRNRVPRRTAVTMTCVLVSLGIAMVDLAMLAGLAFTRVMAGF